MDAILHAVRNLGPMRMAVMGAVGLVMIGFFIYITSRLATPEMDLLYGDLGSKDSSSVVHALSAAGIPYKLAENGSQIMVPGEEVARARFILADQGIPGGGSVGYEIFDQNSSMGTTNFVQNLNMKRALEGELADSIQTIMSVNSAKVLLVLPKRELFSRERQEASASVTLRMSGNARLEPGQILAVQHLVATAVPDLLPSRVSIIDNKGKLLAAGFEDENDVSAMADKTADRRKRFENKLARTIEGLLEQTVGLGKVRAEVSAEMDFDRVSIEEEAFDPDGQVVRSTQTIELSANAQDSEGAPPVSVGTNLPDPTFQSLEGLNSSNSESRTEETVNFEISRTVTNHVREIGEVLKLSVAVLIDGRRVENEESGDFEYAARTEEDMLLLSTLVKGAIGFDASRGDIVELINMEFTDFEAPEEELEFFFGMDKNDMLKLAEFLVLGIVAILVILLVVRPLISKMFDTIPQAAALAGEHLLADQSAAAAALAGPAGLLEEGMPEDEQMEELIDIDRVEGRVKASAVKKVGEIVEKHPEEALSIIRNWMYQEN